MAAISLRILMHAGRPAVQRQAFKVKYHNMILLRNVNKGKFQRCSAQWFALAIRLFPAARFDKSQNYGLDFAVFASYIDIKFNALIRIIHIGRRSVGLQKRFFVVIAGDNAQSKTVYDNQGGA